MSRRGPEKPEHAEWYEMRLGAPYNPAKPDASVLSRVRKQGATDYCSYYAIVATIEARMRMAMSRQGVLTNIPVLSVQHLVDYASNGVTPASLEIQDILDLVCLREEGLVSEVDYDVWRKGRPQGKELHSYYQKWKAEESEWGQKYTRYHIHSHTTIENSPANEQDIKSEILRNGPIVGVEHSPITLEPSATIEGGLYGGHTLSIIGFRQDNDGQLLWVVQNSLGTEVGRFGFKAVPTEKMIGFYVPII